MDHLHETAARLASSSLLADCHHGTWAVMELTTVTDDNLRAQIDA